MVGDFLERFLRHFAFDLLWLCVCVFGFCMVNPTNLLMLAFTCYKSPSFVERIFFRQSRLIVAKENRKNNKTDSLFSIPSRSDFVWVFSLICACVRVSMCVIARQRLQLDPLNPLLLQKIQLYIKYFFLLIISTVARGVRQTHSWTDKEKCGLYLVTSR